MYFDLFTDKQSVASEFQVALDDDIEILFAQYTNEDYSGDAYVLFRQGGTLYEVAGGHCSCNGLEEQWEPAKTDAKTLAHYVLQGTRFETRRLGSEEAVLQLRLLVIDLLKAEGGAA